jgi:hypothetical protein
MSIHNYIRNRVGDEWDLSINLLAGEVKVALPAKAFTLRAHKAEVCFEFVDVLTAGEITTLDAAVAANRAAGPYARTSRLRSAIRLRSPDGSNWRITVNNAGVLQVNSAP